jgi:methylated-DNA-[protein]-cysteine S-methyltransferase
MMWFDAFNTPIGKLTIAGDDAGLRHVLFAENKYDAPGRGEWRREPSAMRTAREQLVEYFAGERTAFDLALAPTGTPFQVKVWTTLAEIPFGQTWSYGRLAARIGSPKAVRAVGAANGRNPLPLVLPCHRVIGSNGSLTGFGGGLPVKKFLLELEAPTEIRGTALSSL